MNDRKFPKPGRAYTVFKPTSVAFARMPPGVLEALERPENRAELARLLAYHVLPEKMDFPALRAAIIAGGGMAQLRTISGGTLTATLHSPVTIALRDERGGFATLSATDLPAEDGVAHVVDRVLMPATVWMTSLPNSIPVAEAGSCGRATA